MKIFLSGLFFNYDGTVRTHHRAHGASDALALVGAMRGKHALFVALLVLDRNDLLGTCRRAKLTALAAVEDDAHFCHSFTSPFYRILSRAAHVRRSSEAHFLL